MTAQATTKLQPLPPNPHDGILIRWVFLTLWMLLSVLPAAAQLDDSCVVTALNRGAQVREDGSFWISQIPADVGLVRVRATCIRDGVTITGASPFFEPMPDDLSEVPDIVLDSPPLVPTRLTLTAPVAEIAAPGESLQLLATADYPDTTTVDVTEASLGTSYAISNPAIATVDSRGLVTGVSSGTVLVSAFNEGALGVVLVRVAFAAGEDSDGDGIPDAVEIALGLDPNDPLDGFQDLDDDGLANVDEINLGTGPNDPDSDDDGILDGEEVVLGVDGFETNPLLADTDGDLLRDNLEIQIGTDPTDPTSFDFGAALTGLTVAPNEILLARYVGDPSAELTRQLVVSGALIDGEVVDLTSTLRGTTYGSSDLLVCSFTSNDGEVLAGNNGECDLTVSNGSFSATVEIEVRTLPRSVSSLDLPGFANDVAVDLASGLAFVAGGSAGLLVIDVSDPSVPVLVGTADTAGTAIEVVVSEGVAYVADDSGGLVIVDVAVPSAPIVTATVATGGRALDVAAGGGLAFVASGTTGLAVVDVLDPAAPQLLAQYLPPSGGSARAVARRASDGLVAVATLAGSEVTLALLDVTNGATPQLVGSLQPTTGTPYALGFVHERLMLGGVLSSGSLGLVDVDISDPSTPTVGSTVPRLAGGLAYDLALDERLAYVADTFFLGTVPILDLSAAGQPVPAAYWTYNAQRGNGHGIAVGAGLIFLAEGAQQDPFQANGPSRLRIAQYVPRPIDAGGVPPAVTVTEPLTGAVFVGGRSVILAADANDDVAVSSVSFFVTDTATGEEELIGVDTTAPYAVELGLPTGPTSLDLRVVARDTGGRTAEDLVTIDVLLNQPPTLTLTAPTEGSTFFSGDLIEILADASDPDGSVVDVAFSVNGVLRSTDTTAPYRGSTFATESEPTVVIEAVATDDLGATVSDQLTVMVIPDPLPVVTILQPAEGATAVAELPLTIVVDATDNEPLSAVIIRVDGVQVFSAPNPPYQVTVDVPIDATELLIEVTARDRSLQVTNASRTVPVVASDPPTVVLVSPLPGLQVTPGSVVVLEAQAADDVGVATVELLLDGTVVASFTEAPYRYDLTVPGGVTEVTLSARATDTAGQVTVSDPVVVDVLASAPPTVALTAPADGSVGVVGETVVVTAVADDDVGVVEVRFAVDGVPAATDTTPPYGFELTVPAAAGTTLSLTAEAEDSDGQVTVSAAVSLEVVASDGTAITGRVVDAAGDPLGNADVTCADQTTSTAGDGSFLVTGLPVDQGDLICHATATFGGRSFFGRSVAVAPVPGGTADSGDIVAREVVLIAGGEELRIVDPATGDQQIVYMSSDPDETPIAVAVRVDGFTAVVTRTGRLQVIDVDRGNVVGDMGIPWTDDLERVRLESLAIHPITGQAYGTTDSDLRLYRLEGGGRLTALGSTGLEDGSSLAFAADGTLYQVGNNEALLQVLDPETGAPQQTIGLAQGFRALAIHPVTGDAYVSTRDQLSTLDLTTGIATPVAPLALDSVAQLSFGTLQSAAGLTVVGTVVDDGGLPVADATVVCFEQTALSAADGSFSVLDVPSNLGAFRCRARFRDLTGDRLRGLSPSLTPVAGGSLDIGNLIVRSVGRAHYPGLRFPAGGTVVAVAAGDLDGDGLDDVVSTLDSNRVAVLRTTEASQLGSALSYGMGSSPADVQLADLDGNGELDVVTANAAGNNISVRLGAGDGSLLGESRFAVGVNPSGVAVADFDLDGNLDLVVSNADSLDLSVLYGTGGGNFGSEQRRPLGFSPGPPSAGDLNGDGRPDVVVADGRGFSNALFTLMADVDGTLQTGPTVVACCTVIGAGMADVNGDGINDLLGKTLDQGDLILATSRGDGTFEGAMRFSTQPIDITTFFQDVDLVAGDFEGDGRTDVAVVQNYQAIIYRSLPLGGLGARRQFPMPTFSTSSGGGGSEGLTGGESAFAFKEGEGNLAGIRGSAAGDFDGDGVSDLAVAVESDLGLYWGADSVAVPDTCVGQKTKMADLDQDGHDDLLVWSCQQSVAYQLSDGEGGFGLVQLLPAQGAVDVATGDFDGDGVVDVAVARSALAPTVFRGLGSGIFDAALAAPGVSFRSDAIVVAELDGDGLLDLAVAGHNCGEEAGCTPELSLLLGNGDMTFQPRTVINLAAAGGSEVAAMIAVDLNADGRSDLLTANPDNSNMTVVRSLPSGDFLRFSVPTFGATAAVGAADFNRDGRVDLIAAAGTGGLGLSLANTNDTYDLPIELPVDGTDFRGVAVVHLDEDGIEDLLAIDYPTDQVVVLRGLGDGTFEEVQKIRVGSRPVFLTTGDLDGDGRPDFAVRGEGIDSSIGGALTLRSLGVVRHH